MNKDKYLGPSTTNQAIQQADKVLNAGGLVGIPTETVYGLAARIDIPSAVNQVFELKQRPKDHPLIVHIGEAKDLSRYACEIPGYVDVLIKKFWPGPLTLILKKTEAVSDLITANQDSVAIRMPNHPLTLELLRNLDAPLVAPSANKFMQVSPTSADHVREGLGKDLFVLDGGECRVGIESTIIDARNPAEIIILRPGMISREDLVQALGSDEKISVRYREAEEKTPKAPGLCEKHYSPTKPLVLLNSKDSLVDVLEKLAEERGEPASIYFLSFGFSEELFELYQEVDAYFVTHDMPTSPELYAKVLYGALHEADDSLASVILLEAPPKTKEWVAIWDRLGRAAG